jgi:capsule polysaccharide export protein KpsC/LpsZ
VVEYPSQVLTKSKKGKLEVRSLINSGRFVRYRYIDPETGRATENKHKLVLITEEKMEEFFIIPLKDGRFLMIPTESKGERMVWDGEKALSIDEL